MQILISYMNHINTRQHEHKQLDLMLAQRRLYSKAKRYVAARGTVALLFAIIGPILTNYHPDLVGYIGLVSLIYILTDTIFFERLESSTKLKATKIRELFDVYVLELPWNKVSSNSKPDDEDISAALNSDSSRDYTSLYNWYSVDDERVDINFARFLCQRSNLRWDVTLRKIFVGMAIVTMLITVFVILFISMKLELTTLMTISGLMLPVSPLFALLGRQIKGNIEAINCVTDLKDHIDNAIEEILENKKTEDIGILPRNFQDAIFNHRKSAPMIFDWVYWLFRNSQEGQMQYNVHSKIDDYLRSRGLPLRDRKGSN